MEKNKLAFNIIELSPAEWQRYKKIRLQALQAEPTAFAASLREGKNRPIAYWQDKLAESAKGKKWKMWFAEINAELVGMIQLDFDQRDKRRHLAKLRVAYVVKKFRGQGVGTALIEKAFSFIKYRCRRIKKIALNVNRPQTAAFALYKELGFRVIGIARQEIMVNNEFYDQYLMEKIISPTL